MLEELREQLKHEGSMIYVADCAMVTKRNLILAREKNLDIISRFPENFDLCKEIKVKAWELNNWEFLGTLSDRKQAATYKAQTFIEEIDGISYRLIVFRSSSLDKKKEKSIEAAFDKEKTELEKKIKQFVSQDFACEIDASKALKLFLKENSDTNYELEIS